MKKILLIIGLLSILSVSNAQEKCVSSSNQAKQFANNPVLFAKHQAIEISMREWIEHNKSSRGSRSVATIPVVIHIVHSGEAIGTGGNVSDAQVMSQIDAANKDFRNLNDDSLPDTHAFYQFVADAEIELCLAMQDPNGNATTGIDRIDGLAQFGVSDWLSTTQIDSLLKPATIWDANKYLNLWVLKFDAAGEDASTLGYATFPEDHGTDHDGVVFRYNAFGTTGDSVVPPNELGRTATHEIGHYFNLHHIWGDANCGDDSIADTPPQVDKHYGCPTFPDGANNSCGSNADGEMFMNYMDYVDDACMMMFTQGQADWMQAAVNGPRQSLLGSNGCQAPSGINNVKSDLRVKIYPNPTSYSVHVSLNRPIQNATAEIFNSIGQKVFAENFSNSLQEINLNISSLSNGAYTLVLSDKSQKYFAKVLLNK